MVQSGKFVVICFVTRNYNYMARQSK